MRTRFTIALLAVVLATLSSAASAECLKVSGKGTGVTEGIAQFMAEKALKDSIAQRELAATGASSMSCDGSLIVVTNCVAQQRACK